MVEYDVDVDNNNVTGDSVEGVFVDVAQKVFGH